MTESTFYARIYLSILFGVCFIYVMMKSARKNPADEQGKHIVAKVFGSLCFVLSILLVFSLVRDFTRLEFPESSLSQPLTSHSIIRNSSQVLYWGYPTSIQNKIFMDVLGIFQLVGFGLYFVMFRSSDSSTGMKILKVILCVLLYFFMSSSTDLHYFDIYELFAPILTIVLLVLFVRVGKGKPKDIIVEMSGVSLSESGEKDNEITISKEDVKL